jgi:hypothetical protein
MEISSKATQRFRCNMGGNAIYYIKIFIALTKIMNHMHAIKLSKHLKKSMHLIIIARDNPYVNVCIFKKQGSYSRRMLWKLNNIFNCVGSDVVFLVHLSTHVLSQTSPPQILSSC